MGNEHSSGVDGASLDSNGAENRDADRSIPSNIEDVSAPNSTDEASEPNLKLTQEVVVANTSISLEDHEIKNDNKILGSSPDIITTSKTEIPGQKSGDNIRIRTLETPATETTLEVTTNLRPITAVEAPASTNVPVAPKTTTQKTTAKNPKRTHNQSRHFSEGALRGANEINREKDIVRDPILEAVAAGSVVRRAKEERMSRKRTQTRNRLPSSGVRNRASGENNEWKNSLRFLARTAASTAKTVARVAAPVVMDAKHVVVSSATEFAQDVRTEWKKESEIHATIAAKGGLMVDSIDNLGSQNQNDTSGKVIPVQSDKEADSNESGKQMLAKQTFTSKTDTANAIPMPSSDDVTTSENALTLVPTDSEFQLSQNAKEEDDNGDDDIDTPDSGKEGVPKKCIYEELQIMEENFETQLETVQSQIEVLASPKEERKDGEEDEPRITMLLPEEDFSKHDFSENTTEITFLDKDSAEKQSTSIEPIDMDLLSKSVDESFVTTEENLNLDESEIAFDESESQKSRGQTKESRSYNNSEVEKQNVSIDCDALVEVIETRDAHSHEEKLPNEKACSNENDLTRLDPTQGEEITMDNEGCNSETQDQETNSSQEKKIRTRSGRVVKPVRRLVDGFDTSIGGENQYGATEKQIDEVEEHSILAGDSIADEDHPKEAVENGEGLDQISAPLSTENQDLLVDRESKLNAGIGLSTKDGNEDKDSDSKTNAHIMETPREKETKQAKDNPGEMIQTRTAKSGLFSLREDSLYQREEAIDMKDTTLGDESNLRKKFEEERYEEQSRSYFIQSLKDHGLIDRQNIVKFVVTKLTGLEISVERKRDEFGLLETRHECCVPDSIFDHQLHDVSEDKSSMSSLSSPPEIESSTTEHSKDLLAESRDEDDQIFSIFDCIPGKQEVSEETYVDKCSSEGRMVRNDEKRTSILRQGSGGSINGSSCSFSTQQRSSRSNPFLPRRSSRRLRRQGSRLSLSMSNTLSTRSPLTTPIENRSTVDDKCNIDGSQADQRGQMVGWDAHVIEGNFSVVPDTEDMTEAYERSGPFFETLMAISTLENTEFLKEFPCRKCTEVPEPIASLIWRQLIANWKHSESFKAMSAKLHPTRLANVGIGSGFLNTSDDSLSSMTTIQFQSKTGNVVFSNDFMTSDTYKLLQYTRAVRPSTNNGERLFLTDYLCDIGPTTKMSVTDAASIVPLRHCFSNTEQGAEDTSHPSIERIQDEARTNLPVLQNIMNKIVNNSTHNSSPFSEIECDTIHSSFGIKDYRSIRNKARRKYGEDVSQVKDVLRGQITFPDEGSLVCGLFCLHTLVGLRDTPGSKEHISMPCFEIVRLKNLFRTSDVAKDCTTPLPTGYRHILINLRFESGFIAELQFQLAQLFGVMDTGGYLLHQSLVSYEYENSWAQFSNRGRKDMTKMDDHKVFDVTPTGFVSSILSSSDPTLPSCKPDHRVGSSSLLQASAQPGLKNPHQKAEEQESKSTSPVSIAALAAQAALKKSTQKVEEQESKSIPPVSIAALAAQAALKKSTQKVEEQEPKSIPPVSIAALAAQAALKKSTQKVEEQESESPPMGDISALTAQAALKKSKQQEDQKETEDLPVGIAALAAQAALKKSTQQKDQKETKDGGKQKLAASLGPLEYETTGPIDNSKPVEKGPSSRRGTFEPVRSFGGLQKSPRHGIGGLAAQIKQAQEDGEHSSNSEESMSQEQNQNDDMKAGKPHKLSRDNFLRTESDTGGVDRSIANENSAPPPGGIAALAAQAALKRDKAKEKEAREEVAGPPPGGIAALAAQAALKRDKAKEKEAREEVAGPPPGGIAALAAQAALKRDDAKEKEAREEVAGPPPGGIAALAAQAALKRDKAKEKEKEAREEVAGPPPGGIAALAAQAALKRHKFKGRPEGESEMSPTEGIARIPAVASSKKSKEKIPQLSTDSTAEGTAARQKASAGEEMMTQSSLISEGLNLRHYSMEEALPAVLNAGVREATSNPRDLASLYCLYILTLAIKKNRITLQAQDYETPPPTLSSFSRKLLMTSLLISNQANSTGMIGWLEYGASSLFERGPSLPLEVMEQLSCSMAAENDWEKASDVLSSLVLRCRQNLPPCHPQTISSMLDLAGAQSKAKNFDFAKSIISEALHLVSSYLCEAESFFFDQFYLVLDHESHLKWDQVVTFDDSVDIISALQEFSKDLKQGLSRNFLKFLGKHHRITLLNNSIVGDSFSVLANCLSAGEPPVHTNTFQPSFNKTKGESNRGPASRRYWSLAYKHYELSFRGWIALESLIHPNAATLTFSIARCLRELGKTAQAIKLLETLASCLEQKLDDEISQKAKASEANLDSSVEQNTIRIPLNDSTSLPPFKIHNTPSFFPCGRRGEGRCLLPTLSLNANQDPDGITDSTSCEREQTAVVCFWTMAVLIAEESPDERGRSRALSLLHTASMAIRRILSRLPESGHSASSDQTRLVCLDLYNRIETEALDLFEPLARIPQAERFEQTDQRTEHLKKNPSSPRRRKHAAPWEISTPMREKRQWTSPRRNRKHAKQSTGTKGNVILSNVSRDRAKVE